MNKITVIMGEYPQNCGLKKEPVEWIVLKEEQQRCLCISFISCVNFDGYIERAAQGVEGADCCIRPAFWLRMD